MENIKIIGFCKHKTAGWHGVFYYGPSEKARGATAIFVANRNLYWPVTRERAEKVEPVAAADFPLDDFISGLEETSKILQPSLAFTYGLLKALKAFKESSEAQSHRKFITDGTDVFEVVDVCQPPYFIWNIGENMIDGYLPLCRLAAGQSAGDIRRVDQDSLRAVPVEGAKTILKAIGYGLKTSAEMEAYIEEHKDAAKPGSVEHARIQRYETAIPLMKQVKGL